MQPKPSTKYMEYPQHEYVIYNWEEFPKSILTGVYFQAKFSNLSVENESHCDFTKLREMLIRTNMEDMREVTHHRHYELYRKKVLETVRSWWFLSSKK